MRIRRTPEDAVCIELSSAEARVLLDELSGVRGGARLPKLRQVCDELEASFALTTLMTKRRELKKGEKINDGRIQKRTREGNRGRAAGSSDRIDRE
jgi:hypothetical protein